ncbi:MAG: hypothetical protein OQJ97_14270 [Rhodospirillales bacterium]|nr:hypothetical protein [Rhodospirillales bacterium]
MKLSQTPYDEHPFNWEKYSRLYDAFNEVADGFHDLGHVELGQRAEQVRRAISRLWDDVVVTERTEQSSQKE